MGKKSKESIQYQLLMYSEDGETVKAINNENDSLLNLPRIIRQQKEFFELIKSGHVDAVSEFLQNHPWFDINCVDYYSCSPLEIAINSGDRQMVEYLLDLNIDIKDCLLHAAEEGDCDIVQLILNKSDQKGDEEQEYESVDFMPEMTPLIIAAQHGSYPLIQLLLDHGYDIKRPHMPNCVCTQCGDQCVQGYEGLDQSRARYNMYKALSNPMFICQSSSDPILTAFELSSELSKCSSREREYKMEYNKLSEECEVFAMNLLNQCRTTKEVEMILQRREGYSDDADEEPIKYPRLDVALACEQKKFVAHPNCQKLCKGAWLQGWESWYRLSIIERLILVVPQIVLLPVFALVSVVAPKSRIGMELAQPINKFISQVTSFFVFLIILKAQNDSSRTISTRGPPNTGLEFPIVIYIISLVWIEVRQVQFSGITGYFYQWWNIYDMIMYSLFLATFGVWAWAYIDIQENGNWNTERMYWDKYDPSLVSEALFAVATVLAYGRLLYLLEINQHLGPLQVSISRMGMDIAKFMVIFCMITFSFGQGITRLYQHYDGQIRIDKSGVKTVQSDYFMSMHSTMKSLFWSLFGLVPPSAADIVVGNTHNGIKTTMFINKHKLTEATGYQLFGAYHVIAIIVLINLLIALMSNSFDKIVSNADTEWKFARTKVWVSHFEGCGTIPPPFNLLPTPLGCCNFVRWVRYRLNGDKSAKCSLKRFWYFEEESMGKKEPYTEEEYKVLMTRLVRRFLSSQDKANVLANPSESDLIALIKDVKDVKRLTRHLIKQAGGSPSRKTSET